jgi:hypothetical protein
VHVVGFIIRIYHDTFIQRILITNVTPGSNSYIKIPHKKKTDTDTTEKRYAMCTNTFALLLPSGFQSMNANSYCTPSTQQKVDFTQDTKYMGETIHHRL